MNADPEQQLAELLQDPVLDKACDWWYEFECPDALDFVQCVKEALMARQYVVVETTYGGHEASIGVWGPYTHEEAHAKLRALSGDETATDSGEYGGFDFDAGDVTISVCKMERE